MKHRTTLWVAVIIYDIRSGDNWQIDKVRYAS